MIVVEIAQRLVGKPVQRILVQPDDGLRRQRFIQGVGAHNVAEARADIRQPRLPGLRQFDLQPDCQGDSGVEGGAKAQPRVAFGDHFFRRQVGQGVRLFLHRLAAQFATGLRVRVAAGQTVYRLRLLRVVINEQAALLVDKLDAQTAAFQQLPGRWRQAGVGGQMNFCPFAERMIRSEPGFGDEIFHSDCQFAGQATYRKRTVDGVPNSMLEPFGINITSPALATMVSPSWRTWSSPSSTISTSS